MSRHLLALGLALEAIFLVAVAGPFSLLKSGTELTDLGKLTDYQPLAAVLVTAGLIGLFVLYTIALGVARRPHPLAPSPLEMERGWPRPGVPSPSPMERGPADTLREGGGRPSAALLVALGFTALFSVTLVFLYPVTAIDVYNYAVEGHVAVFHHLNPMVSPPAQAVGDTFVSYAGTWADSTSPYGPIWITLTKLDALLAGSNVVVAILLLKALAAVALVATALLLAWAFGGQGPRSGALAVVLFGWNPLVQLEMVGNGHNDAVMTFFLIAALALLTKNRPVLSALGVGASVLVKFLTLGAIPLFLLARILDSPRSHRGRLVTVVASAAALVALAVVAYAPFWAGPTTLQRALAADSDYLSSIPALIVLVIPGSINWLAFPRLALVGIVCLWQANSLRLGRANLAQAMYEVFFVTILVGAHFAGWYLALLVAVSALTRDRWVQLRTVVFTFTATLATPLWAYLWYWNQDWMSMTTIHLIVVPLTFLPPLLIALLAMDWPSRGLWRHRGSQSSYLDALYFELHDAYVTARSAVGSST